MASFNIDETLMKSGTEGFFKALADAAKQTQKDFGIFASVTLVQAALESAWGKSNVANTNKNLFGIKYTGKYAPGITVEEKGCKCPSSEQGGARYYNYYHSYGDSVYDHGWFLKNNSRYTKAGVFSAANGPEQVKAIAAAGYAEDPNYASSLIGMMNKYNLTQYDNLTGFTGAGFTTSTGGTSGGGSGGISSGDSTAIDILPNVDHRYNIANMDEVKGACLIFHPPYNVCKLDERDKHFETWGWDRKYHYIIDPSYNLDEADESDDTPEITECTAGSSFSSDSDSSTDKDNNKENGVMPITAPPDGGGSNEGKDEDKDKEEDKNEEEGSTETSSPEATEDNCIVIKGGLEKVENRLLQCYGLADNDKHTYISRSLFKNHPEKHTIMIACFIPSYEQLKELKLTYEQIEKNIVNAVSKILWANGLNTKDLWREFDLNRAPSPAIYLDRTKWKDLLTQIDKVLEWRNKKFGVVSTSYEKYIAKIPEIIKIEIHTEK